MTPNGAWGGEGRYISHPPIHFLFKHAVPCKQLTQQSYLVLSLGCGIGYGYLHRIPTRAASPVCPRSKNASGVKDNEESAGSEHSPPSVGASTPGISEVDADQPEGAMHCKKKQNPECAF